MELIKYAEIDLMMINLTTRKLTEDDEVSNSNFILLIAR